MTRLLEPQPRTLPAASHAAAVAPMAEEMREVDAVIQRRLASKVALIDQIANYIISAGGKRIRPLLVLLFSGALGFTGRERFELAATVEFIHTATLLHDDVVDESALRRGRRTANAMFGNAASVLVGDFVYSRAFQMMAAVRSQRVIEIMAEATNVIAEGEVLQLMNARDPGTTEQRYLEVIHRKTARLFQAGAEVAAVVSGASPQVQQALARFGEHLGTAYQLVDDVLDYQSDPETRGKNLGDDLAEGKPTLPLIHALRESDGPTRALIRTAIEHGGREQLGAILHAIESTGGLKYTARLARAEADQALAALGAVAESPFREGLAALARFAIERKH